MVPRALHSLVTLALCLSLYMTQASATYLLAQAIDPNATDDVLVPVKNQHGETVYMTEALLKKLREDEETWHWTPWLRNRTIQIGTILQNVDCIGGDSIDSFPEGFFTEEQLRQGALALYFLFGIYAFTLITIVCNDYFIPCVEMICEDLNIPQNVAAATFMSVATSCPEFFVNVISTFLTESDMGIGTIVGSAMFNALGVAAIGGLAAVRPIKIDMGPVTRDCLIYMFNVSVLVAIIWDGQIDWYEAVILFILYILYFVVMFNSMRLFRLIDKLYIRCCARIPKDSEDIVNKNAAVEEGMEGKVNQGFTDDNGAIANYDKVSVTSRKSEEPEDSLWKYPKGKSVIRQFWWLYTWVLRLLLSLTIPSPTRFRKFYPVAFFMCIVWIGGNSYFVAWSITVIGHTFLIPDSVMGMTFLAFGGCLPEACSIFIMSRRGEGGMGVSNALGANSLAILFALGVPWLIRTLVLTIQGAENTSVLINSNGIGLIVGSLLVAVICLWLTLFFGKFLLRKRVGFGLLVLYFIFITFAILVELGVIVDRVIAFC